MNLYNNLSMIKQITAQIEKLKDKTDDKNLLKYNHLIGIRLGLTNDYTYERILDLESKAKTEYEEQFVLGIYKGYKVKKGAML